MNFDEQPDDHPHGECAAEICGRDTPHAHTPIEQRLYTKLARVGRDRDELAMQNHVLREALEALQIWCSVHAALRHREIDEHVERALAPPDLSADWLRKHDAEVLRDVSEYFDDYSDEKALLTKLAKKLEEQE